MTAALEFSKPETDLGLISWEAVKFINILGGANLRVKKMLFYQNDENQHKEKLNNLGDSVGQWDIEKCLCILYNLESVGS